MTVCEICGGEQFTLEDGFYFCDECHTQSQDIREIVNDDLYVPGTTISVRSAAISEKTLSDRRRRREVRAEVKGWRRQLTPAEVFNELLRRWTAALVARGAPAQLPERTAQLWEQLLRAERRPNARLSIGPAVCLLWLALAECDARCRFSDLLRWAREGVVPIYSAANELPEDVTTQWTALRRQKLLRATFLQKVFSAVLRVLRLPPPPRPPLGQLLRRLLSELALPARLADVVVNVARRAPPPHAVLPEASAMALLLVTLKLLLGLDDATEVRNSEVAAARNAAVPDGPRWFVFTEWLQHVRQRRAAAGERDYLALERHDRGLVTASGPDPCRSRHRKLLFDFYRREGVFRCAVEAPFAGLARFYRPEYKMQTGQLFGRPEAPAAPPPDADDLLRPLASRLEREGGEPLRQAEALRDSQIDYLLDEAHVRRLEAVGVRVAVTRAAARRRAARPFRPAERFRSRDVLLVRQRVAAVPVPETAERRRWGSRDLRLFMPSGQVWCVPGTWLNPPPCKADYRAAAADWPVGYRCLMEMLAATIELTPAELCTFVCRAEKQVLVSDARGKERRRRRKSRRVPVSSSEGDTDPATEPSEEGDAQEEAASPCQQQRGGHRLGDVASRKRPRVPVSSSEEDSATEPVYQDVAAVSSYSPDLFE